MARSRDPSCPCRARDITPVRYADCCGRWHDGLPRGERAPTPEALMRSRYSAYALAQGRGPAPPGMTEYLMKTWHPSTAPGDLELGPMNWTGLDILHHETRDDAGVVEFVAHHKVDGRAGKLHEVSRFVRESGAWLCGRRDGAGPRGLTPGARFAAGPGTATSVTCGSGADGAWRLVKRKG